MATDAARTLGGVAKSTVHVSTLVAAVGLGIIIGPGYLNPLRFGPYFIAIGTICFFVPGVLGATGGLFLQRERRGWPWAMAIVGILMQLLVAIAGFGAQFHFSPISPVPLVLCATWAVATAILLWRLTRIRGAIEADADAHRGFVIKASVPPAAQIDSVREK
jgi:hypothetical protein